jgi:putative membrane protein
MRSQFVSPLSLALSLALGCALALSPAPSLAAKAHAAAKTSGDGEALALLEAADQAEVDAARQALAKGVTGGVHDFAQMLQKDHGDNLKQTRALAASTKIHAVETAAVKEAKKKALAMRQKLQKLSGDAYAKAYIDAMVDDHKEDLDTIDNKLVPESSNAQVIAHFKATREAVAKHLAAAQALQAGTK